MFDGLMSYIKDEEFRINIYHNRINIVNYLDVISLDEDRVSIKYNEGNIVIKGEDLLVKKILDKEILIIGSIKLIEMG